jgi:hypothetical protein
MAFFAFSAGQGARWRDAPVGGDFHPAMFRFINASAYWSPGPLCLDQRFL